MSKKVNDNKKISVDDIITDEDGVILKSLNQKSTIIMNMQDTIEFLRDDWDLEDEITISELKERMLKNCLESEHNTTSEENIKIFIDYLFSDIKL